MTRKRTLFDYALWAALPMAHTSRIEARLTMILDKTQSRRPLPRRVLLFALIPVIAALVTLAVLRPDIKAQQTTTATNNIAPIKIAGIAAGEVSGGQWTGRANGNWWNQNGAILSQPVYETDANHQVGSSVHRDQKLIMVAFHLPEVLKGATFTSDFAQSTGSGSYLGQWPAQRSGQENLTEAQMKAQTSGPQVVVATFPAALTRTDFRVGVASGPWITAETSPGRSQGSSRGSQTIMFSPVADTAKGLAVTVTTSGVTDDMRVVAVDWKGRELTPDSVENLGSGSMSQITGRFDLPLKQLKEFRFETRPFVWIEYKNVALQPVK
jgi:hypothetical protein